MNRWNATIAYRHDGGIRTVTHALEEIEELAQHVEHGPHWDTIDSIEIHRTGGDSRLTVEASLSQ